MRIAMESGVQLIYADCLSRLIEQNENVAITMATLSWVALKLNFQRIPALSGISFCVVSVDYPGKHLTIGAKYSDDSVDLESVIVECIEHLLSTCSVKDFLAFTIQNDCWKREAEHLLNSEK
jgi:hypothetical protein